jgi:phage recombination protein Bet
VETKIQKFEFTDDHVALIKKTIAPTATNDELQIFLHQCKKTGLDPLAKQIYFNKYNGKMTVIVGIDGYRLIAERTGAYAGSDDAIFEETLERWPTKASVTIYKLVGGIRCPFTASARWDQYYPGKLKGFMWDKMPHAMLAKCAEGLALRKAFPSELSGTYTKEEMEQATPQIQGIVEPAPKPSIDGATGEVIEVHEPKVLIEETEIEKMFMAFKEIGIDVNKLEALSGLKLDGLLTGDEFQMLRSIYAAKLRSIHAAKRAEFFLKQNEKGKE